jgi:thymidylate synthase
MLAQQRDQDADDIVWTGGYCHPYSNHTEQVEQQLAKALRLFGTAPPPPAGCAAEAIQP